MAKKGLGKAKKNSKSKETNSLESSGTGNTQRILIENFVSLQRIMADLSSKLNNLAEQMSKLLGLFEESAKTFMEKDIKIMGGGADKGVSEKLDQLLEQNKILARGIALLHESNQHEPERAAEQQTPMPTPAESQQFTQQMRPQNIQGNVNRYQKSISSSKY